MGMRLISSNIAAKADRNGKRYSLRSLATGADWLANSAIASLPIAGEFGKYEKQKSVSNRCLIGGLSRCLIGV